MTYMFKSFCNTRAAASAVGISVMTLQRWIADGQLNAPGLRIVEGRAKRLWRESDLAELRRVKKAVYCKGRGRKKKR